ncbi:MAG: DNA alkylation repair protein [Prevotella sp.]|nr:DNA alkylation repair protein [Prevotella sp.]
MKPETQEILRQIKSRFRLMMNGVVSQSMRNKGLGYKINWGISFPELKRMANEYDKDYELAVALWKEDIRECKILATLIMPANEMLPDMAELWVSEIPNYEMAEMAAFNLFQYIDNAKDLALKWLSSDKETELICGYNVLSRLFMKGEELSFREINEFIDQSQAVLGSDNISVRHAALNSLSRFSQLSEEHKLIVDTALKNTKLSSI